MLKTTRVLTAAAASAALLLGGACSSGDDKTPLPTTSGATVSGADLADRMANQIAEAGSGSFDVAIGGATAHSDFAYEGEKMKQHVTVTAGALSAELLDVDGTLYAKGLPGQAKPWVRVDPKATDPISPTLAAYARNHLTDPEVLAGLFRGELTTVRSSAGGVTTYDVSIDPAKIAEATGVPAATGADEGTGTVSLDGQGRPTKVDAVFGGQKYTITYSDWGVAKTIEAPPKDQVGDYVPVG